MNGCPRSSHVRTGCRVHFGLIDIAGESGRSFGGLGVMLEEPALELRASPAMRLNATGPLAARVLEFARRFNGGEGVPPAVRFDVLRSPSDHVGLGTGTQLALSTAAALSHLEGRRENARDLARRIGRGQRSGVGVHGFELGGLVVDGGKAPGEDLAPLIDRLPIPEPWRFVLVLPQALRGLSGGAETAAFDALDTPPRENVDALCRLVLLGLLPALAARDHRSFGEALHEYGRRAGEPFRCVQKGAYAHDLCRQVIEFVRSESVPGAGQSSWGPTCYAVVDSEDRAFHLAERLRAHFGFDAEEVVTTAARNRGAEVGD